MMWIPELCSECNRGHFIPTGNGLNEARCDNCDQRRVYVQIFEQPVKIPDDIPEGAFENPKMQVIRTAEGD
jgi:hypothetical protein